jgi:hypothetical protein
MKVDAMTARPEKATEMLMALTHHLLTLVSSDTLSTSHSSAASATTEYASSVNHVAPGHPSCWVRAILMMMSQRWRARES